MKTLAVCLLMGLLGAVFAMDRVAAQTAPATGTQLITLGTAGGPMPRADRAQSSNLLVVNGALYLTEKRPHHRKKERSGLQSACDELIDKGAIITGE